MTDTEKKKRLVDALERIATTAANAYQRLDDDEITPELRLKQSRDAFDRILQTIETVKQKTNARLF